MIFRSLSLIFSVSDSTLSATAPTRFGRSAPGTRLGELPSIGVTLRQPLAQRFGQAPRRVHQTGARRKRLSLVRQTALALGRRSFSHLFPKNSRKAPVDLLVPSRVELARGARTQRTQQGLHERSELKGLANETTCLRSDRLGPHDLFSVSTGQH